VKGSIDRSKIFLEGGGMSLSSETSYRSAGGCVIKTMGGRGGEMSFKSSEGGERCLFAKSEEREGGKKEISEKSSL